VKKECSEICEINGEFFAAGTCLWSEEHGKWMRAVEIASPVKIIPSTYYSFVVSPSACIETEKNMFRDYVEVHSKELEAPYSKSLCKTKQQTEC
jgi:hypothetical protein